MKKINNPHDKFFKQSLSDLTIARDFLKTHLPANILAKIDLNEIELCKESYIDEELQEQLTDLVFKVKINSEKNGYIYTLLEHQSTAIKMMPFRIVKYQLAIMENHLLQYPNDPKLPAVFPLLFYHGLQAPYPYPLNFLDLFHDPAFAAEHFARNINIVDLTQISDQIIREHKLITLLEYAQKHIRDRDFLILIDTIKELVNKTCSHLIPIEQHLLYINGFFKYIITEGNISNIAEFIKQLEEINIVKEHKIMGTLAQHFEEQGLKKGEVALLLRQLKCKFKKFPDYYLQKIQQADPETLLTWGERIIYAKTLEDVFKEVNIIKE